MKRPILPTLTFIVTSLCLVPVTGALYMGVDAFERDMIPHEFEASVNLKPMSNAYRLIKLSAEGQIKPGSEAAESSSMVVQLIRNDGVISSLVLDVVSNAGGIAHVTNLPTAAMHSEMFIPTLLNQWLSRQRIDVKSTDGTAETQELATAIRLLGQGAPLPWKLQHFNQHIPQFSSQSISPWLEWIPLGIAAFLFLATLRTYARRCRDHHELITQLQSAATAGRLAF